MRRTSFPKRLGVSPKRQMLMPLWPCWSKRSRPDGFRWSTWLFRPGSAIRLLSSRLACYCRVINTSCIISFHRAKFFLSNFRICIPVPNVEAMFYKKRDLLTWFFPSMFSSLLRFMLLLLPNSKSLWYHLLNMDWIMRKLRTLFQL